MPRLASESFLIAFWPYFILFVGMGLVLLVESPLGHRVVITMNGLPDRVG
jgi:hypothetical protein